MTKEDAWKILKGECTLPEAMKIFGRTDAEIKEKIDDLNSRKSTFAYFAITGTYVGLSYDLLVQENEIDASKIFNLASHSFDEKHNRHGDFGRKGDERYRFVHKGTESFSGEWEPWN